MASYSYDPLNRLTRAPLGTYTYGGTQLHGATSVGSSYTASYDAAGDMVCQAPTSAQTCSGSSPTGQVLGYDSERHLVTWQNAASNPTSTAQYAYDGAGQRVAQAVTNGGSTTTTHYVAGLEDVTTSGSTTTLTKYESLPGVCGIVIVGSGPSESLSYLATDGLGSVSEALSSGGSVTAQQLYGPYGAGRYTSGSMPTAKGFTGQYADGAGSGLDYYSARYYDAAIGQFGSGDTAGDGLNRYAYVHDDPETFTDPTGQRCASDIASGHGPYCGGGGCMNSCSPPPPPPPHCTSNCGGGGGGGKGDPPKPCPDGTYASCNFNGNYAAPTAAEIAAAKNEANRTAAHILVVLGVLMALSALIAFLLVQPMDLPLIPVLLAVGAFLTAMIAEGTTLIGLFNNEATNDDSWWTVSNLGTFSNLVAGTIGAFTATYLAVAAKLKSLPASLGALAAAGVGWTLFSEMTMDGIAKQANDLES